MDKNKGKKKGTKVFLEKKKKEYVIFGCTIQNFFVQVLSARFGAFDWITNCQMNEKDNCLHDFKLNDVQENNVYYSNNDLTSFFLLLLLE